MAVLSINLRTVLEQQPQHISVPILGCEVC
jgi:hypothetical protein